ncbi:MAG: IS630 transposase-related protein [Mariprofundaceae bacterium]|nr:IS630 transposase-related protein [Mariprofundaceae bacterium]
MAYSEDLRARVIFHVESGNTQLSAAKLFNINYKTVRSWLELKKETGSLKRRKHRGGAKCRVTAEELKVYVDAHPNAILADIAEHFGFTIPGIFYHLRKHGYVRKKNIKIC